jgi:lipoprotein-anchoring transpeptidase ErfK/SrfK
MVLKIADTLETASSTWYKIGFDEWIRYTERMQGDWYVNAEYVTVVSAEKASKSAGTVEGVTKRIIVDRGDQMMYAYDGDELFMKTAVSTGKDGTLTPRGNFTIYKKVPSRYMQGPLPGISDQVYDLPGVPWTMYFTEQGGAFHGAYWHDKFGQEWSHGCVNLPVDKAEKLYDWADIGTKVLVRD